MRRFLLTCFKIWVIFRLLQFLNRPGPLIVLKFETRRRRAPQSPRGTKTKGRQDVKIFSKKIAAGVSIGAALVTGAIIFIALYLYQHYAVPKGAPDLAGKVEGKE